MFNLSSARRLQKYNSKDQNKQNKERIHHAMFTLICHVSEKIH